ncbi:hypothetical protein [Candidatus Paracaedibacter symbiosus]|uniref:hypothetical protein n=1 Tax=Candidatus Paracaedibacter symbiosus TaxID=244582 RepID=UPI000509ACAF|nr:hypothetical protein [Candidatus Paracaedibacter symbiosus]
MLKNLLFLSIASSILSFSLESGLKISTVTAAEVDFLPQDDRVNMLGNKQPKYTPQEAAIKVKKILQTMQAREQDFGEAFEIFMDKFSDPKTYNKERMEIIDPFWSRFIEKNKPTSSTMRDRLKGQATQKKATERIIQDEFQKQIIRSRNAVQGFGQLIGLCDQYVNSQDQAVLMCLLDSLLVSHLLNLKPTLEAYMPSKGGTAYSHISLKKEEIDTYYTQDSRLAALSQLYYIIDYVRPIDILIKAGLQPEAKEWDFAEKVQQYVKQELTLEDPSIFLMDGFLYQRGIEKAEKSTPLLQLIATLNGQVNTGGVLRGEIEVKSLLPNEKEEAKKYYNLLYKLHRSRVESYIKEAQRDKLEKINRSRDFLNAALRGESEYTSPQSNSEIISSERMQPKKKKKKKKTIHQQKRSQQKSMISLLPGESEEGPTVDNKRALGAGSTSETSGIASAFLPIEEFKALSVSPLSPPSKEETSDNIQILKAKLTIETSEAEHPFQPLEESISKKSHSLSIPGDSTSFIAQPKQPNLKIIGRAPSLRAPTKSETLQKAQGSTLSIKNGKHLAALIALRNPAEKPFTILYLKALNAMSKIGISELPPKKGGDFRKLVRYDSQGNVIGRIAAYKPATPTLGRELMKIYRDFINAQLEERPDLSGL